MGHKKEKHGKEIGFDGIEKYYFWKPKKMDSDKD